ncbi:MAG: putative Phospholipid methyltransferase [Promethearchaeota archaeon]|nr:MAG: putative Phospholipid methyltransferase [Candidatus Lokiarchaeota archaeon]
MFNSTIIRIFIIILFFFFGYNITFIIIRKRKNKHNGNSNNRNIKSTSRFGKLAKVGIIILNVFITLVCLNIFFYEKVFRKYIPQIQFGFLSEPLQIIGLILAFTGNVTLNISYRELGVYWEYPIDGKRKKQKLITTGIYSRIRHPIYLSFYLISIGFWLILFDVVLLILLLIGGIGLYLQALEEEKLLLAIFGDIYKTYQRSTGRFFAKVQHNESSSSQ